MGRQVYPDMVYEEKIYNDNIPEYDDPLILGYYRFVRDYFRLAIQTPT